MLTIRFGRRVDIKMKKRELTVEESLNILKPIAETEDFINFTGHRKFPYKGFGENVYRFTVNLISLDMLINIMEHDQVMNVYFTPTAAGPGQGIDGISMIYKVYVKYHLIEVSS